jgi:hypothetical protein
MKLKSLLALAAVFGALSLAANAQDGGGPPPGDNNNQGGPEMGGPGGGGPGGPGGPGGRNGHRPPAPLIVAALDANHDGVIDADEIANASTVLKSLDKKGDGKLTWDEYMGKPPKRPGMDGNGGPGGGPDANSGGPGGGQGGGPGGQGGPGGHNGHRPIPLLVQALDANHDGIIDADEIANASTALMTLDKRGDGKLTPDEFLGKPPGGRGGMRGPGGPGGGPDGQGGPGGGDNNGPQGAPPGN